MSLNVGYTCGTIDDCIGDAKKRIKFQLEDFAEEINTKDLDYEELKQLVSEYVTHIYTDIEEAFEGVRNSNKDLRDDAEYIIEGLKEDNYDKDIEIQELNDEIYRLHEEK